MRAVEARAAGAAVRRRPQRPALPPGSQQVLPYSYGGSGELFFSKEQLDQIMAGMRLKKSGNTRLIEGGRYNVNLRWNGTPSVELHEQTIDTWVVLAGGATVNTGYEVKDGERVPNTGVSVVDQAGRRVLPPVELLPRLQPGVARHLLAEHPLGRQLRDEVSGRYKSGLSVAGTDCRKTAIYRKPLRRSDCGPATAADFVPGGGGIPRIFAGLIFSSRSSSRSVKPLARSAFAQLASASGCQFEFSCPVSLDTNACSTPAARMPST